MVTMMSKCVLYDRECIDCGECDQCSLDPNKRCDNCMKCITEDADYRGIVIDRIILPTDSKLQKTDESDN